jgi:outer membrane biogenesis lipoprotein LolB
MDFLKRLCVAAFIALLAACSSSQDKAADAQKDAYKAQESVANQRLKLVDQYQQCVKDAGENKQKAEACDSYLKAADALQ